MIYESSLSTLDPGEYIADTIVNAYTYIRLHVAKLPKFVSVGVLDTVFYQRLQMHFDDCETLIRQSLGKF